MAGLKCFQVREPMRTSREALQELRPAVEWIAEAVNKSQQIDEGEDEHACMICLDQPCSVTFHPCSHSVTCTAYATMVMKAKQALCPLCRAPIISL